MIQVNNLNKSFGGQVLLEDANFQLSKGEKVGLVGRNGSGKSTFLKILAESEGHDSGEIKIPKNYSIGFLRQHIDFSNDTVLEEALSGLTEEQKLEDFKVKKILSGLGFSDEDFERNPSEFSGGFQLRIELCKVLGKRPSLLLLDEPTNYLDLPSIQWLQKFIRTYPGEVILITHDREFMDNTCDSIVGITRKSLKKIKGKTEDFYHQIVQEEEIYERTRLNQDKKRQSIESFVERFKAKASKAKQAQSRMKMLDKMGSFEKLAMEKSIGINFRYKSINSKYLVEVRDLAFGYDEDLFDSLSFDLEKGDCLAVIGKNGKGKSTLLKNISGEIKNHRGNVKFSKGVAVGNFGQTNVLNLNDSNNVLQEIESESETITSSEARSIAGSLLFEGDLALKQIKVLSGGEKNRVLLGKIMGTENNVLLLDEPTNHLDMESIDILKKELAVFEGASIIVSHTEDFIRTLANKLIYFRNGNAHYFEGNYDAFLEKIGWEGEALKKKVTSNKINKKELKRMRSEIISQRSKQIKPHKENITQCENSIHDLEEKLSALQVELEKAGQNCDGKEVHRLSSDIGGINDQIETLFEKLESSTNELEKLMSEYDLKLSQLED